ncbi:unnamed protein product [Penicillium glandicola]
MARLAVTGMLIATASAALSEPPYFANMTWQSPRTLSNALQLNVETKTGTFTGLYNDTYPNVRQFLHIPFAQPPLGDLRWLPPQKLASSSKKHDSTMWGPACPQYVSSSTSMWNEYEPSSLLMSIGEDLNQGSTAWSTSEDCLSLAVWTPAKATKKSKLPVALFVTGGGGVTGGIPIASQLPAQWVSHPKSRALSETSLTLLDVRAAVEWVSENIEAFGGDKQNIMLWGQSQGAALTHLYTLAFPEEPLVARFGIISQPPTVTIDMSSVDDVYQDFDIVAKGLGCNYGDDYEAELNCMRRISWVQIEEYINRYSASPSIAFSNYIRKDSLCPFFVSEDIQLTFFPIADEKYIFSNETKRYLEGKVAKGPAIRSDAAREQANQNTTITLEVEGEWDCTAASDAAMRYSLGLDTYRYYWTGNFTNISPASYLGAFHWSDLLMIFGTYMKDRGGSGEIPQLEVETSAAMQDFILAFLKDPTTVSATVGWPKFDPDQANGGLIVEFGNGVAAQNVTGNYLDGGCYNSSIPFRING